MEYHGNHIITNIKIKNEDIDIFSINNSGSIYVDWRVGTLMGEPVVSSKGVVILPEKAKYHTTYKNKSYEVPGKIIEKISVVSVKIKAHVSHSVFMDFDLGAMGDIYFGTPLLIPKLSKEDKNKYLSFNVSGSPAWEKIFYHKDLGLTSGYLPKEQAKTIFTEGIEIIPLGSVAEVTFNLIPVINWIENKGKANQKKNKTIGRAKKEDPFTKFNKMDSSDAGRELETIDKDIRAYILEKCGKYYTTVREGKSGFHLTAEYIETKEEAEKRRQRAKAYQKKRKARVRKAKQEVFNELPGLQRKWKEKRAAIKTACRAYIMKKYGLTQSVEALEELLNHNFTSTDKFKAVYYIPYDGY